MKMGLHVLISMSVGISKKSYSPVFRFLIQWWPACTLRDGSLKLAKSKILGLVEYFL